MATLTGPTKRTIYCSVASFLGKSSNSRKGTLLARVRTAFIAIEFLKANCTRLLSLQIADIKKPVTCLRDALRIYRLTNNIPYLKFKFERTLHLKDVSHLL